MIRKNKHKTTNEAMDNKTDAMSEKNNNTNNTDSTTNTKDPQAPGNETQDSAEPSDQAPTNEQQSEVDPKELLIRELENKYNEINDKYLRLFSEFDNFRKRSIKERLDLTKTASAEMTEAVLPVLDDLERANKSYNENPDLDVLGEGITLIYTKLTTILKHKGLEEIHTIGQEFNTDFHEAITHIPAPTPEEKGKVLDEVQKGYMLNGKIIRFAKVVVGN